VEIRAKAERRLIENLIHTSDDQQASHRDFLIWYGPGRASLLTSPPQP